MKKLILIPFLFVSMAVMAQPLMTWDEAYEKAEKLVSTFTLDEKLDFTHGHNTFFLPGIPEKGLPYIYMADASCGLRVNKQLVEKKIIKKSKTTQFPATIALAASFNPELASDYARSIGEECRAEGVSVLLAPGMNIYRNSQNGRNFEYLGEDPYLTSQLVAAYVTGLQSTGTLCSLKHFLCNNTEFYRRRENSIVDERAIMEIYTPAFKAGIDAGAATVMTAYNKVNGEWAGQSKEVITDLLRGRLGFRGLVMSDWRSVYDWSKIVPSGQNVDMPGDPIFYIDQNPRKLVEDGRLTEKQIEDMIIPQIATCIRYGLYDRVRNGEHFSSEFASKLESHKDVAYQTALEGTVLLKNNGILPLDPSKKVLLAGRFANKLPQGGGSSKVKGYDLVTFEQALNSVVGGNLTVIEKPSKEDFARYDVVVVATGTLDAEGTERPFAMDKNDEALVRLAVETNPNTVVVINSGSAVRLGGFVDSAAALLYGWYPGQNGYQAIADIIYGKRNPSGKLPFSIEREFAHSPAVNTLPAGADLKHAQGNPNEKMFLSWSYDVKYEEGVFVGYRWYEKMYRDGVIPEPYLYAFGHGLSYTTFDISNLKILGKGKEKVMNETLKVQVTLANTGNVEGAEVVQLYVAENNPTLPRPLKELKAFRKVNLQPAKKQVVEFILKRSDLAFWDVETHNWKVNPGEYTIFVGNAADKATNTLTFKVL